MPQPSYKTSCPICDQRNGCGLEEGQSPCWCMADDIEFSEQLLEQVPDQLRDESCICENCVRTSMKKG
ncbi:MAG: cysteine-rich CWC family protein [Pseudomonadales bacterium]|nr:cysteine-rich CWC family protein [Pseudomonadales bacterium]